MPTTAADYPKYGNLHIRPAERPTIGLILLMGMMLSFATAWLAQQAEYNRQKDLLAQQSERFSNDLTTTFDMNMELLSGLRGLYLASNNVEMDEFILYSQPILLGHPEIQLLAWAPRLTSADLLVHEIKMRSQNAPSYALHPGRDPNTNALLRSEYFPISYLSPTIGNEHYLGLDMAAYPALQKTLIMARDSGLPAMSAPDTFVHDKQLSVMLIIPIYSVKNLILSSNQRRQNLIGFVLANYRLSNLLFLATSHLDSEYFNVAIEDVTEHSPVKIIDQPADVQQPKATHSEPLLTTLNIAGRRWELSLSDTHHYPLANQALLLFGVGILITFLIIAFLIRNSQWRRLAEHQVELRTAELKDLQQRSEQILNNTGEAILGLDINGYTTFINNAAQKILGYTLDELHAQQQHSLIHHCYPDGRIYPRNECNICRAFTDGITITTDQEVFWRKDGSSYPVEYTVTPIRDNQGMIQGAVVVFRDISERKQSDQELIDARIHAEDASRAKSAFLATMSHEIRTPMNGMLGMAQLLAATALDGTQKEYIDILLKSGKALLNQVNDILDFSRIEADRLTLESAPFDLFELCTGVIHLQQTSAEDKRLKLNLSYADNCPHYFLGDSLRLRQILLNLISNAIKFTHHGSVSLHILCGPQANAQVALQLLVKDTGIGMEPSTIDKLFNPFSQADASTTRQYGGSGLGLAISKRLAELMHARLQVSSTPGEGSTFALSLTLPMSYDVATVVPQANTLAKPLTGHVLLAEDNQTNRRVAEAMLQNMGLKVTCAENGLLALQLFGQQHFDMVLMDCQMPVMDGYQASRMLRKANAEIPILALTANVLPEDMTRCIEAGMNDCVRKPIEVNSFRQTLARWLKHYDTDNLPTVTVNTRHLDNMAELMGAVFIELIPAWLRETEKYLAQLMTAAQITDYQTLERVAHALKASSGNVGAAELSKLATKLERTAQEKNTTTCTPLVEAIKKQFPIAKVALVDYQKSYVKRAEKLSS